MVLYKFYNIVVTVVHIATVNLGGTEYLSPCYGTLSVKPLEFKSSTLA